MRVKSVEKYRLPYYPDKKEVLRNPVILKSIPQRWKGNVKVGIALSSLLCFMLSACEGSANLKNHLKGKAAPIFEHGDGRGSFGCDSVAPPAFLSEEEAFEVIREEAELQGINISDKNIALEGVDIPVTNLYSFLDPDISNTGNEPLKTKKGDLVLDGYDEEKRIGFEYVSKEDYTEWHKDTGIGCSVEEYNTLEAARLLQNGIEGKTGENIVGVFYDPVPLSGDWIYKSKKSEEQLREQVRDFINWLKAEGII